MIKPIGNAVSVVITFVVTLFLNTALNYYTSDKGVASISSGVRIGVAKFVIVTIENQSTDFIADLILEVPSSLSIESMTSVPALVIEDVPSAQGGETKLLKISQIGPRQVSRIFVPAPDSISSASDLGTVRLSNLKAAGLSLRVDDRLDSPFKNALFTALFVALLYAIFEAISAFVLSRRQKELNDRLHALNEKHDAIMKKHEADSEDWSKHKKEIEQDLEKIRVLLAKQRLLLQSRLNDYSRELHFWRNAVRSLLLRLGEPRQTGEQLVERVTSELKTFGTRAATEKEFETLRLAGRWLTEAEGEIDNRQKLDD